MLAWMFTLALATPPTPFAPPTLGCDTAQRLQRLPLLRAAPPDPGEGPIASRDPFLTPVVAESEHFALRWGTASPLAPDHVGMILDDLEHAWQIEVEELGWDPPVGSEAWRLNVYIGNSGDGAPDIDFSGGYASIDPEGYSYIVLSPDSLWGLFWPEYRSSVTSLIAHEFNHTLQFASGSYSYLASPEDSSWYWEATASWVVQYVADTPWSDQDAGQYMLQPHVGVDYFQNPFEGDGPLTGRQYSAHVFVNHLSEIAADAALVRDTWREAPSDASALQVIDRELRGRGTSLAEAFPDFASRMTVFDYERGYDYQAGLDEWMSWYPGEDESISAWVGPEGTDGLVDGPKGVRPWAWGYNTLALGELEPGPLKARVVGDPQGSKGSPTTLAATLVRVEGSVRTYDPLVFDGLQGTLELEQVGAVDEAWLIVAAVPIASEPTERFGYRYAIEVEGPPEVDALALGEGGPQLALACGCASGPSGAVGWLPLLGALLTRR